MHAHEPEMAAGSGKQDFVRKPARKAVRLLVERFLDDAARACARLGDPGDGEALHDLRVALRRLASVARAWAPQLGECLPKKLHQRIRDLAAATNAARDGEVQLAWLGRQQEAMRAHERAGYFWLITRLRNRLDDEYAVIRQRIPGDFARLRERVEARLRPDCEDDGEPIGIVVAGQLMAAVETLRERLDKARRLRDGASLHKARIAVKRLRYLFEPFAKAVPNGKALIRELKSLQDWMGEIHDIQVFGEELIEAAQDAGAERQKRLIELTLHRPHDDPQLEAARRGDERTGLIALARDLHERREDLLSRFFSWLDEGEELDLCRRMTDAAQALREMASASE